MYATTRMEAEVHFTAVHQLLCGEDPATQSACLDTLATAFAADASTGSCFYVGADSPDGLHARFWRALIGSNLQQPNSVLHYSCGGKVAAVVSTCDSVDLSSASQSTLEMQPYWDMLTPAGKACFIECHGAGGLWQQMCSSLYQRHGAFYSFDFLAVHPSMAGQGCGHMMFRHVTEHADNKKKAMFLVATSTRLSSWYQRYGFKETLHKRYGDSKNAFADLVFMERVPRQI